ncbi:DUF305 domain-containing protein [Arthrobacter sp. SX1312]|uniref:DUF305 domain-containing protein n=1 Tax=Arthrobacter sp. SX1312 TaxID=2058896 RepID=UPI000CE333CA|nr:DUF305 domain-containing protein [Arthrobacter sp. SX1312]
MKRSLSLASLSIAALITLSACGSSSGGSTEGAGGEISAAAAPSATAESSTGATTQATSGASEASAGHNDADVMFAQMMIPHHQQAVEMSDMMLAKDGISPDITDLAAKIKDAQGPEIETMTGWLEAWDEPMEPEGGMEGHSMSTMGSDMGGSESMEGMMSEDQMSELESAEGTEASRIFLESMTAHHEGAVTMAENEIDNGQNPDAIELAETIVTTQQAEIAEMQELLAGL